jgi:hypothetical protein
LKKVLFVFLGAVTISFILPVWSTGVGVEAGDWWVLKAFGDLSFFAFMVNIIENIDMTVEPNFNCTVVFYVDSVQDNRTQGSRTTYVDGEVLNANWFDEDTSSWNPYEGAIILPANLDKNERLAAWGEIWINDTVVRTYPSGDRLTNCFNFHGSVEFGTLFINLFFDRATGIIVEFNYTLVESNSTRSCSLRIIDTNIGEWVIPEFPSFLILPLFMLATLLALMVYKRNGYLRKNTHKK